MHFVTTERLTVKYVVSKFSLLFQGTTAIFAPRNQEEIGTEPHSPSARSFGKDSKQEL
jgi:hypothetical protein